jgi:signal transduction histidine kinase
MANAAHELRTPRAILTAGLEAFEDSPEIGKFRDDAARVNRLVAQLLRVARLDADVDIVFVMLGDLNIGIAIHLEFLLDLGIGHLVGDECQSGRSSPSAAAENFILLLLKPASAGSGWLAFRDRA